MPPRLRRIAGDTAGFTMIELLGVTVVVIILSMLSIQIFDVVSERARTARSRDELRTIEMALERYRTDFGYYPNQLSALVKDGYIKQGTTFESAWSSGLLSQGNKQVFYFYAVDNVAEGQALAYALGDPGRGCTSGLLHPESSIPLPCGRDPNHIAYSFASVLDPMSTLDRVHGHATLRQFRTNCKSASQTNEALGSCDLKTES